MDKEAFEFLSAMAIADDQDDLVNKVLERIGDLEEKPMFIGRSFLEETAQRRPEVMVEDSPYLTPANRSRKTRNRSTQYPEASSPYRPYAKDMESKLEVLEDPTGKLSSNGTMDEFQLYFQDRFKRMEKILRQRMDVKSATPISEALKAQPKSKLKIIGMVTEKREAKQQLLITIEDLNASATILVPYQGTRRGPEESPAAPTRSGYLRSRRENSRSPLPSRRHNFP